MIKTFDHKLEYRPTGKIKTKHFLNAEFEKYDKYTSKDLISGVIFNNCHFSMSKFFTGDCLPKER